MKTFAAILSTIWAALCFFVQAFLLSLLSGGVIFLVAVVVVAFLAWIVGAASPRDAALISGCVAGGLWAIGEFSYRVWEFFEALTKVYQEHQVKQMMEQSDD